MRQNGRGNNGKSTKIAKSKIIFGYAGGLDGSVDARVYR